MYKINGLVNNFLELGASALERIRDRQFKVADCKSHQQGISIPVAKWYQRFGLAGYVAAETRSYLRHFTLSVLCLPRVETRGYKIGRADGTGIQRI